MAEWSTRSLPAERSRAIRRAVEPELVKQTIAAAWMVSTIVAAAWAMFAFNRLVRRRQMLNVSDEQGSAAILQELGNLVSMEGGVEGHGSVSGGDGGAIGAKRGVVLSLREVHATPVAPQSLHFERAALAALEDDGVDASARARRR